MAEKNMDFGREVSKMLPVIIREATRRQMSVFSESRISIPHLVILEYIRDTGPARMSELAKALNLTMGAVTAIADKMIRMGLVKRERSSEDRRVVRVALLKKGREIAERVQNDRRRISNDMFAALTGDEKREYLRLLQKVYEGLVGKK